MLARVARLSFISSLALVAASPLAACKDKEQTQQLEELQHKVTAESTADANAAIVDEELRFRIEWPGAGWKMLGRAEARRLNPDALAGAIHPPDAFAAVIVEHAPGVTPDGLVDLVLQSVGLRDLVIDERAPFTIAGKQGVRVVFHGYVDGTLFRYVNVVFTHQDHGYQLLGWGQGGFDVAKLDPLWSGFSLLDGEVRMPERPSVREARGPGWRVKDGVFESAVTGVRVEPGGEWSLAVGHELVAMNPDAEVGLTSRTGAFVVVIGERVGETTPAAYREAKLAAFRTNIGEVTSDAWQTELFGAPASFSLGHTKGIELMVATHLRGETGYQLLGFYPEAMRDAARTSLKEAFGKLTLLDPAAQRALRDELIAAPDVTEEIGSDYSIHAGSFRDFANGVSWSRPLGLWKLTGPRPEVDASVRLKLEEIERGVYGELRVRPAASSSGEAWFAERMGELTTTPPKPTRTTIGEHEAWVGELAMNADGLDFTGVLLTVLHGNDGVSLLLIAPPKTMAGEKEWIASVHRGLAVVPALPPTQKVGARHEDLRMGIAIEIPAGLSHERRATQQASASHDSWSQGGRSVQLIGLGFAGNVPDPAFAAEAAERTMRSMMTEDRGPATDNSRTVGDLALTWHTWTPLAKPRVDSIVTTLPDGAVILIAEGLEASEMEAVATSLRRL